MIAALGVGLPTEAHAQSSGFNGTQATTYTLTTGANTATFTFGSNAVIGPTGVHMPGVTGDTITAWNIINHGQINGGSGGGTDQGIFLTTPGSSVTNSGTIKPWRRQHPHQPGVRDHHRQWLFCCHRYECDQCRSHQRDCLP
jgi:hypothetical protein